MIFFRITLYWKHYRVSGSSDDWKMLSELSRLIYAELEQDVRKLDQQAQVEAPELTHV